MSFMKKSQENYGLKHPNGHGEIPDNFSFMSFNNTLYVRHVHNGMIFQQPGMKNKESGMTISSDS